MIFSIDLLELWDRSKKISIPDFAEKRRLKKLENAPPVTVICQGNGWTLNHIWNRGIPLEEIEINGVPPTKGEISLANMERINKGDRITLSAKYADILLAAYNNPKFREGVVKTGPTGLKDAFPDESYLSDRDNRGKDLSPQERKKLRKWRSAVNVITQIDSKRLPLFIPADN